MKKIIGIIVGILLFSVAGLAIKHQLSGFHYADFQMALESISWVKILMASVSCALSYLVISSVDILAMRYLGKNISSKNATTAAFLSYAIGNNVGFALGTSAIRFKLYSALGLTAVEIGQIVIFGAVSLWLGFFALSGSVFLLNPVDIHNVTWIQLPSFKVIGVLFLLFVFIYFGFCATRIKTITLRGLPIRLPVIQYAIGQTLLSSADWIFSAYTLYLLLPANAIWFPNLLAIFLIGQMIAMISQVPGGLGVFETVVVTLIGDQMPSSHVLGALLIFRAVFYLAPFAVATVVLLSNESKQIATKAAHIKNFVRPATVFIPNLLSIQVFISGLWLMISGAAPILPSKLSFLEKLMPLVFVEVSHFLGSIVGLFLLFLAYGLRHKRKSAYYAAQIVLLVGAVFSLVKGFNYEVALFLICTWALLKFSKRHFYRRSRVLNLQLSSEWLFLVTAVLTLVFWMLLISYNNLDYSESVWWQVQFSSEAPRSYRAMLGLGVVALLYVIWQFVRPNKMSPPEVNSADLAKAKSIVQSSGKVNSSLALLGDKHFVFAESGRAFIMYGVQGRSWIALGDPVGPEEEWSEILWRFTELADLHDGKAVFYQVRPESLNEYLDLGMKFFKLGEEAIINLKGFSLEGSEHRDQRGKVNKLEKEGGIFEVLNAPLSDETIAELKKISDEWLEEKNTREKGFSLGFFEAEYLRDQDCGVVRCQNKIVAFANIWRAADQSELSVDLIRYSSAAPKGSMDYLFIKLMLWGSAKGYRAFSLGMAPLSGLSQHPLTLKWNKIGGLLFKHGEHFYNFEGLRRYKDKFHPEWEPRYLASTSTLGLPMTFLNLSALISGGLSGVFKK